ncbi:MAG: hypothetical protein JJ978_00640 [Roseivirga sp.]|jgi:hypothetical protein|uniref:hypothetical protein n=1 Tax=Roseivirga sp. TaxID=1964215 RepID=UPI001B1F8C80|nr:hypothetical protein [Roseivirga sp.]MBO6494046.1 hypothetical protein [Roseivirga sp.]
MSTSYNQEREDKGTQEKQNDPIKEKWEKPIVSELGSLAKDTENEFNFLNDANQLT